MTTSKATVTIDLSLLYADTKTAKLADLVSYEAAAIAQAGLGNDIILTGAAPVWLYLRIAHVLHGKALRLFYNSPVTGQVLIFDHNPFGS